MELQLPALRGGSLKGSNGVIRIDIEDSNEAIKRCGGGNDAGGVGGDGDNAEAVAGVGSLQYDVVIGGGAAPEADGFVEGAGEEEWPRP